MQRPLKRPLVSAIMPAFNQADLVGDAIRSAVEQDYPNLQIVVSDDGSTDGTVDVIMDWASRFPDRVIPIVNQGHLGVTENCNRALRRCRGELRAFHAGDDLWLPGKISRQVTWFEEDSRRVLCAHDVETFDAVTGRMMYLWSERHRPVDGADPATFVLRWPAWHPLSHMVRASALPPGGYDASAPIASDFRFFVECVASGGIVGAIPGVYARYRSSPGSVSSRRAEMWRDLFTTLDWIANQYPPLAAATRAYRHKALYDRGRELMYQGDVKQGRASLLRAVALRPWSWRSVPALAAAATPSRLTFLAVHLRRRLRRAG